MNENIISQLASQMNIKSNVPNKTVAKKCIKNPILLKEIAIHLSDKDLKLAADCAEVMTEVALSNPELITRFVDSLISLLKSKDSRTKWESMHALSLIAEKVPDHIFSILPEIEQITQTDKSIIVRDYATDTVAKYAGASIEAASHAYPVLKKILYLWDSRHAARVIEGLINIYKINPAMKKEFEKIAEEFKDHPKAIIRKTSLKLKKVISLKL